MTITADSEAPPVHSSTHELLSAFLGNWRADGQSYGGKDQPQDAPKSRPFPWVSTINARWYTGNFFLVQDERADSGGQFDTLSVLGVDAKTGKLFAQTFENHGFERRYDVEVEGNIWTFSGESERARIEFSDDSRTQTIAWEWKPNERWLPLCDRTARRVD